VVVLVAVANDSSNAGGGCMTYPSKYFKILQERCKSKIGSWSSIFWCSALLVNYESASSTVVDFIEKECVKISKQII
jgi:hypothetical protein